MTTNAQHTPYQMTGISFPTAMEAGDFLRSQGFEASSEGFTKICGCDGERIDAGYTLTKGRCFVTMKHRPNAIDAAEGDLLGEALDALRLMLSQSGAAHLVTLGLPLTPELRNRPDVVAAFKASALLAKAGR